MVLVESFGLGTQTGFQVAQALSIGKLGKGHAAILFRAEKRFDLMVTVITFYVSMEGVPWKMIHEL